MTSQPSPAKRSRRSRALYYGVAVLAAVSVTLGACEKKKKKAPPPPPPPPPVEAVIPDPVDINGIMAEVKPDARVQFPEKNAPADRGAAEAIIRLASDLAKGDPSAFGAHLDPKTRPILDTLVSDGSWTDETKRIEQVRIVQIEPLQEAEMERATVVMAIQTPDGAYPLAWEGRRTGSNWVFSSVSTEDVTKRRASDFDDVTVRLGAASVAPEPTTHTKPEGGGTETPEPGQAPEEKPEGPPTKSVPGGKIPIPQAPGGG
jgi:hypothetical protein